MSRDRFPVSAEAVTAVLNAPDADQVLTALRVAAPLLITSWIAGLTDAELLSLRFNPGADWCQQMRAELTRLAEGGAA